MFLLGFALPFDQRDFYVLILVSLLLSFLYQFMRLSLGILLSPEQRAFYRDLLCCN